MNSIKVVVGVKGWAGDGEKVVCNPAKKRLNRLLMT